MLTRLVRADVAPVFQPLLGPSRYKAAWGGRGGAKSHFYAEQLLLRACAKPTRAVCIREVQQSLKDSVYQLLKDKTQALDIGDRFNVMDTEIRGPHGSLIIFRGMQSYNAESIKSLEAYDVAWVEEAQTLSDKSLGLLRPTIRKDGSELWFSWNPRHRTDPVDVFFRKNPHPDAVCVRTNWRDNPWFPEVLRKDMLHDKATDPELAEHVWEGGYGVSHGAILTRQIDAVERAGRINDQVEYDPDGPAIEISSDLGFRDTASWWFWQRRAGGFALLDYDGDSGLDAEEWIPRLQERLEMHGWPLGQIWLPHDAKTKTFQSRHSAISQFVSAFGHRKCSIVARTSKADRVNAARTIAPKCEFHTRCAEGLDGLRAWEFEYNEETQVYSREPAHTWASHPSDAFSYGCQVMTEHRVPEPEKIKPSNRLGLKPFNECTLEELWEEDARDRRRYALEWI